MKKLNGGELVAKALKKEGVECVFTLTGGHIMPILYACTDLGIKVIDVRHENSAGYAADAYARVTGKLGVIITTAGPGVTNTLTAMAEAKDAGTPVIHIGGAAVQHKSEMGTQQDIDTVNAMGVFCKWAKKITDGERIPEFLSIAFRHALDDTPGPVYLELPMDKLAEKFGAIFEEENIYFPEKYRTDVMAFGDPSSIKEAAKLLAFAKKPVMVIGEQARYTAQYGEYVEKLVNFLKIPVLSTSIPLGRGVFADESKNELFLLGEAAAAEADVILELAVNNTGGVSYGRSPFFNKDAKIIQVHPDKTKIGFNTRADIGIIAGAGAGAMQLFDEVEKLTSCKEDNTWVDEAKELTAKANSSFIESAKSDMLPMHPGRLGAEVSKFLDKNGQDWHVICDGGDAAQYILYNSVARYPGQVVKFSNLGTIGTGAGFSIGAWAADKKPVLYYTGDGSFGFYTMEFDTMAKQGIPVVCVISNDSAWGMIKMSQELAAPNMIKARGGHHSANLLHPMRDYEKIAASWGGLGLKVTSIEGIVPAIEKVWKSGKPGIVNVIVSGDVSTSSPRTKAFAGIK